MKEKDVHGSIPRDVTEVPRSTNTFAHYDSAEYGRRKRQVVALGRELGDGLVYEACVLNDAGSLVIAKTIHGFKWIWEE
jgi:hypothetical protein